MVNTLHGGISRGPPPQPVPPPRPFSHPGPLSPPSRPPGVLIVVFLFLAVWVPCCTSDIVFPLIFARRLPFKTHDP